jgi:hypothetical protein
MAIDLQLDAPYVGPRPFEREHQNLFFGRSREANELVSLVIAHRTVLLYAPSGAGKSSLINAGLSPLLEREGFEILPSARVQGALPQGVPTHGIANIYVFNVLLNWAEPDVDPAQLAQLSLVDFLGSRKHLKDEIGLERPRLLIFDQFEELFTSYSERWQDREGFFRQVNHALVADPLLRVIFSMREDYLGQLDGYSQLLPERPQTRLRLARLGRAAALAAIIQPLRGTGHSLCRTRAAASGMPEPVAVITSRHPRHHCRTPGRIWRCQPTLVSILRTRHPTGHTRNRRRGRRSAQLV